MASKQALQRECDRLTQRERDVQQVSRVALREFWSRARGNFAICGGTEHSRILALSAKLYHELVCGVQPVFVLTTSERLEDWMIWEMNHGCPGKLTVTSPRYRNYHFFYGWTNNDIMRFLTKAAPLLAPVPQDVMIYFRALLNIVSSCYPVSLASLSELSRYSDEQIQYIGQRNGVPLENQRQIERYAQAGEFCRILLSQIVQAFQPLTQPDCATRYTLCALSPVPRNVYFINVRSGDPELLHLYFSMELRMAQARTPGAKIIFSDVPLLSDNPLRETLRNASASGAEIGISSPTSGGLAIEEDTNSSALHDMFSSRLILLNTSDEPDSMETFSDRELEAFLAPLGKCSYYEVTDGGGAPPVLFPFLHDAKWTITSHEALRVRPQDTIGFRAVLSGGDGRRIWLARNVG